MRITPDSTHPSGINSALEDHEIAEGRTCLFLTGPIAGTVVLSDATSYDVTDTVVAVKPEHVAELQLAIHKAHHAAGRFTDVPLPRA